MYLIRHVFSSVLFLCATPLFGLLSLASPLDPSLPKDLSFIQQVNGSSNPLSDFLNNVNEGVNRVRQKYPAAVLYYLGARPDNPEMYFTNFRNVRNWKITLCLLRSDQLRVDSICILSSQIWGLWEEPYETSDLPSPPFPAVPPNPWNLNGVIVGPITAWNKGKAGSMSQEACTFVGLRKPSNSGRDVSPFQPPEIMWSFRFIEPQLWVHVGAATGQTRIAVESIEGNNETMGSSSVTTILYGTNCTQNATTRPLSVDSDPNTCAS